MCLPATFCCGQSLKSAVICAALYTVALTLSMITNGVSTIQNLPDREIMMKQAAEKRVKYTYSVTKLTESGIYSTPNVAQRYYKSEPVVKSEVDELKYVEQAALKHSIEIVFASLGLIFSAMLIAAISFKSPAFLLPWLSWFSAHLCHTTVEFTVDIIYTLKIFVQLLKDAEIENRTSNSSESYPVENMTSTADPSVLSTEMIEHLVHSMLIPYPINLLERLALPFSVYLDLAVMAHYLQSTASFQTPRPVSSTRGRKLQERSGPSRRSQPSDSTVDSSESRQMLLPGRLSLDFCSDPSVT